MRILWIGKGGAGEAGDEIYDRKVIAALERDGVEVRRFSPVRVSRAREIANLVRGVPHYRTWYEDAGNRAAAQRAAAEAEVVVASWEPFDRLASAISGRPVIPILHNVTSLAIPSLFPGSLAARLLAWRAAAWERKAYRRDRFAAVAVLSRADEAHLRRLPGVPEIVYAPPGMPPRIPLAPGAGFRPEIVLSGTYDWRPKRRDVIAFARELAAIGSRWPVHADPLPGEAEAAIAPRRAADPDPGAAIRLGVIPDRFEAGHKLKTTSYLANNAVVLSYADVSPDFADLEDHPFFIRRIAHASQIAGHAAEIASVPAEELRGRLERFKARCVERFAWEASAAALLAAAARTAGDRG